ncbi:MAG TPA: glucose 1-dehydrogenase [Dehalococcoidia bacterium]|nr:glucose 1-dehydrogenase [Dehalococcoidia bacterium]
MRLDNQVAIITGGASGIGLATALTFAREGARIVVADVRAEPAEAAADQVRQLGRAALALAVDVVDPAAVQAMVDRVVQEFGGVDVLVAAAGIARAEPFLTHRADLWQRVIDVNLTGVFYCCQAVARQMATQRRGKIINIASINGFRGVEHTVAYNASKAGVVSLTLTMAVELAQYGINVNAIAPAQIETPMLSFLSEQQRRIRLERLPLERFGRPEEIAAAALFLASSDADFVTGHTLAVDGGYLAGGTWSRSTS